MPFDLPRNFNIAAYFIDRPAREHPERIAVLGPREPLSYAELAARVNRAASALQASGCTPGERVLIVLPDSIEFVAAFFGAAKIGAVAVPVNSALRAADYTSFLEDTGASIAVVHASALPELLPAMAAHPLDLLVVVGEAPHGAGAKIALWENWAAAAPEQLTPHPTAGEDPAFFLYTSGSGGTPKAAVHQHKDMLATSLSYASGVLGLRQDDRTFSVSKLFFAYGLGNAMYFPFSVGASTVFYPERSRPQPVADILGRFRPTVFFAVPTFYAALLREVEQGLRADFSSVRMAVSAGEVLPEEIFQRFRNRFGVEILDAIGSTEMLHMFISNRPGETRAGTCGVVVPNYDAKIVDDSGQDVPDGQIGDLRVRGPSAFAEYWNKPELTARTKQGGWIVTGDKFIRDPDGYYHYCGRSDDMMKVAGMWVAPGEVENALLGHPAVAEAAAFGREEDGLTRLLSCVVLRPGFEQSSALAAEIQTFMRSRLPSYKVPREILFLEDLPKTATGKIQRFRLRQ